MPNAVVLSAIDDFAKKNVLVKELFRADEDDPSMQAHSSSRPASVRQSGLPSWSEGLRASRESPKEDVQLSPPDDALLKELEAPSIPEGGDWLEGAGNVPASTDSVDDLDLVIAPANHSP